MIFLQAMAARDRQRVDRRSRRGGFVGNFAEPLYEKLALIHDQNYSVRLYLSTYLSVLLSVVEAPMSS